MALRKVVVVGGGISGASVSRVLAQQGVQVVLLEKAGQLCSGATWHAAGLVTRFAGSPKLKKIHVRSLELMTELHERTENGVGLHLPGSIRIVDKGNADRLTEAKQHLSMAALYDDPAYPTQMLTADEVAALHPLLDVSQVECGLYTPYDGDVDPTSLTNAVAAEARAHGAEFRFHAEVSGIDMDQSGAGPRFSVHVKGDDAPIDCDAVVNAAGLWSRGVTDMIPGAAAKLSHPAFVIEHQYAITETVPQVRELAQQGHNGGRLPVLRDLKGSSYIRQEGHGFLIGPYENECIVRTDMPRGPPSDFIMELFPDELTRIEENLMLGMELVPCLGDVGFKTVVNGPTIWTGDSLARCGRTAIPGYFDANSYTYGIAQSLALSDYLGHIMLHGEQPAWLDATDYFDPLRYGAWANDAFAEAKITETYTHNNSIVYGAYENRSAGREHLGGSQYPLHDVLAAHGALFAPMGGSGCEAPLCYAPAQAATPSSSPSSSTQGSAGGAATATVAADAAHTIEVHDQKRFADFQWAPLAEEEARHVLDRVGLAYSSFSKLRVSGPDAKAFISEVTTGALPLAKKADTDLPCRLTYCTTPKGRVQTEFTVCRLNRDGSDWYLVGSRDHVRQDSVWLEQCARNGGHDVAIKNVTDDICVLHLAGPRSGPLLAAVDDRVNGLGFMRARQLDDFAGQPGLSVQVFRVSFTGEMGYELHFPSEAGPAVHDAIWSHPAAAEHELRHVGAAAVNALRIEQGFKFRADLDYAHFTEAGIMPFVSKKRDFLGKSTAEDFQPARASAMFHVETPPGWEWSVLGDSPIRRASDDAVVGYTTTSAWGARQAKTVALGFVHLASADADGTKPAPAPGDELYLDTFGNKWPVQLLDQPLAECNRDVHG